MAESRILGLDMGTNSIGWALIEESSNSKNKTVTGEIVALGSRIFSPPIVGENEIPKNQSRRESRGRRRILARRAMRKKHLVNVLMRSGLLPGSRDEQEKLFKADDPYELRAKGLDESLTLHQFGRVLFHLNQRRGFLSNRKTNKKEEDGKVKPLILQLEKDMEDTGARTLGEFLSRHDKKRERYTGREMYQNEFDLLWQAQSKNHSELTPELKMEVFRSIFFQRPLKIQKYLVGLCQFEQWKTRDKNGQEIETGKRRCMKAHPLAQRYRMLQDVNNLIINYEDITEEQRNILINHLEKHKELTWKQARKKLKLPEDAVFNLENSKKKILGAITETTFSKALGKKWDSLDSKTREELYIALTTIHEPKQLLKRLQNGLGFSEEEADKLAGIELEQGYASLSLKAVRKIVPHLEKGLKLHDAIIEAGYRNNAEAEPQGKDIKVLPAPPQARNPVVQKALYETRKVVNAIMREYGKPDVIRVELARDVKLPRMVRKEIAKRQRENADKRERARNILIKDFNINRPSRDDILKHQLWEESDRKCPYTGTVISASMLFGPEVEIEHILPWSRSLDDSYMNKTLCLAAENKRKHNRIPWEAYGNSPDKWAGIERNIKSLPPPKRNRFYMKEIPGDFTSSQLNDTRYMSRLALEYLKSITPKVQAGKGIFTALLRRSWGLHTVLPYEPGQTGKSRSDHRHHAVDAVVIALTSPSVVHTLSRASSLGGKVRPDDFPPPWDGFRDEVLDKIGQVVVSHRVSRKITGALHEETSYGATEESEKYVYRKRLTAITRMSEVLKIRDDRIRELVKKRIEDHGGDIKKALSEKLELPNKNGHPVPIKSVRVTETFKMKSLHGIRDESGKPYRYVKYGNNHHVEIVENVNTGKRKGVFVTTMEAARRARIGREAIVRRDHGPEWKFIMSLSISEMLKVANDGQEKIYRVQMLSQRGPITLREHFSALLDDKKTVLRCSPNTLKAEKITISPIGELFPAND